MSSAHKLVLRAAVCAYNLCVFACSCADKELRLSGEREDVLSGVHL